MDIQKEITEKADSLAFQGEMVARELKEKQTKNDVSVSKRSKNVSLKHKGKHYIKKDPCKYSSSYL